METFLGFFVILCFFSFVWWIVRHDEISFKKEQARLDRLKREKVAKEEDAEREKAVIKAKAESRARARSALLRKYQNALNFSTYELAEIAINLVDDNEYVKLKKIVSVLSDQVEIDQVLTDASKMLSEGYGSALKEIASTRFADINFEHEWVANELASLVDSCVAIGRRAIGKKIGLTVGTADSSVSKGTIRKTKKWED
jgi:DNA repair ATPase RecN